MNDDPEKRKKLLNDHLDNLRKFQFDYFNHLNTNLQFSERQLITALYSFSTLGIITAINQKGSICIVVIFALIILINMILPTILNPLKSKVSQNFLDAVGELVKPLNNGLDFEEFEKEYTNRLSSLAERIKNGNGQSQRFRPMELVFRWTSVVLLVVGWIFLIVGYQLGL